MTVKGEIKKSIKEWCVFALIFGAYLLTGTMDHEDAVLQHGVNCESATYVFDNNLNCTGVQHGK